MIKYKEFPVYELFDIHPTKAYKFTNTDLFSRNGVTPVVTNTSEMHGRSGRSLLPPTEHDIVTFSDTGTKSPESFFYQEGDFIGYSHVQGMYPYSKEWSRRSLLYVITLLKCKTAGAYDYSTKMTREDVLNFKIQLPVNKRDEIDFLFMERYIGKFEDEYKSKLVNYLNQNGLNNCRLTDKEITVLKQFREGNYNRKTFLIEELFTVTSNPQLNKDSFTFTNNRSEGYPYFTRTVYNNGIAGYVKYLDDEHKISGNSIAVGMLGMQFFYMDKDFYAGQFTKTIVPKFVGFNEKIAQFFITCFNKNSDIYRSVLVRDFEKTFYATSLTLPVKNDGRVDFKRIEVYITALEKEIMIQNDLHTKFLNGKEEQSY